MSFKFSSECNNEIGNISAIFLWYLPNEEMNQDVLEGLEFGPSVGVSPREDDPRHFEKKSILIGETIENKLYILNLIINICNIYYP